MPEIVSTISTYKRRASAAFGDPTHCHERPPPLVRVRTPILGGFFGLPVISAYSTSAPNVLLPGDPVHDRHHCMPYGANAVDRRK